MSTATGSGTGASSSSSVSVDSVRAIATKDFQDAVRSWLFWGLSALFFLLIALGAVVLWFFADDVAAEGVTTVVLVGGLSYVTRVLIPLIALVLGWKAIAGERESGTIKIMLSLPHSRKDVILGKLIGRSAVLTLSLVLGFALAAVVVAVVVGGFNFGAYVGLLAASILYGVTYTGIAIAVSAIARSTTLAGIGAFGVFLTFYVVWNVLGGIFQLLSGQEYLFFDLVEYTTTMGGQEITLNRLQSGSYFVLNLDPGSAYSSVLSMATSGEVGGSGLVTADMFGGSIPFYLSDWFSLLILLFWLVVPMAFALFWFGRGDI